MTDTTWTNGGGDGKASTAANWSNGIAVGYNVIFDETSTDNCTFDYDEQLGNFTIGAGYSGEVMQSSDMHITGYSQAGGTFTGVTTKRVYCSGNFVKSAGTMPQALTKLSMTGNGVVLTGAELRALNVSGVVTLTTLASVRDLDYANAEFVLTGSLTLNADLVLYCQTSPVISITGLLTGNFRLYFSEADSNVPAINVQVPIYFGGSLPTSRTATLTADISTTKTVEIVSGHATNTLTINLNGHNLTASSITVGTRGILQCGEGTIITNALDSSAGTVTAETSQIIFDGAGTLKTNGTDKFYDMVVRDDALVTLASNVTVSNELVTAGELALAGNTLTHESPDKRYSAPMINPIVRNPKRSPIFKGRFTRNFEKGVV